MADTIIYGGGTGGGLDSSQVQVLIDNSLQDQDFQNSVLDKDLSVPPGVPTTGDRYIVASAGSGAWSTHDNEIAEWNGTSWTFVVPNEGFTVWVEDENANYQFDGVSWIFFIATATGVDGGGF